MVYPKAVCILFVRISFFRYMQKILTIFILILSVFRVEAQVIFTGKVLDSTTLAVIPFANVVLQSAHDTTQLVMGTMSDLEGTYRFENVTVGRYRLLVSCVGYNTSKTYLRVVMPAAGNIKEKDLLLAPAEVLLDEVVVSTSRTRHLADRTVYTFTDEQIRQAQYARDLVKTLPQMLDNPMARRLQTITGATPLILINGVKSTEADLKVIPPRKVKKIEYYEIPPARYATVSNVINVITKQLDNGIALGINTLAAATAKFLDGDAYFNGVTGNHMFGVEYNLNYRNYKKSLTETSYIYDLLGVHYEDITRGNEHFGYTNQNVRVKYAFTKPEKQVFQVTFEPYLFNNFAEGLHLGEFKIADTSVKHSQFSASKYNTLNPVVDLYYWHKLNNGDELAFNVNTSFFRTKSGLEQRSDLEQLADSVTLNDTMLTTVIDTMSLLNKKYSVIAEASYTKPYQLGHLSLGYKFELSHLKSSINNLFGDLQYNSDVIKQYVYGETVGLFRKFIYRVSIGLSHLYNKSYSNTNNNFIFSPRIMLGYNYNDYNSSQLMFEVSPLRPGINQLSNNATLISRNIISVGNPNLRNGVNYSTTFIHSFSKKIIDLKAAMAYIYNTNPVDINFYEDKENQQIVKTWQNYKTSKTFISLLFFNLKPFKSDLCAIRAYCAIAGLRYKTYSNQIIETILSDNQITINFKYKNFEFYYGYRIPTYFTGDSFYKSLTENTNYFVLSYNLNNWKFVGGIYFIGKPSHYRSINVDTQVITHITEKWIKDNKTMVNIGVEYNFRTGKNNEFSRKLENTDTEAPTF